MSIYLIIEFNWPDVTPELAKSARKLHDVTQECEWIKEIVAASGGIGGTYSSIWIFELENFAGLDKLYNNENEISKSYLEFFSQIKDMKENIREKVIFQ